MITRLIRRLPRPREVYFWRGEDGAYRLPPGEVIHNGETIRPIWMNGEPAGIKIVSCWGGGGGGSPGKEIKLTARRQASARTGGGEYAVIAKGKSPPAPGGAGGMGRKATIKKRSGKARRYSNDVRRKP